MGYMRKIYKALKQTERRLYRLSPPWGIPAGQDQPSHPRAEDAYPELTPPGRGSQEEGAICIMQIGTPQVRYEA